jgi:hypothetical protein
VKLDAADPPLFQSSRQGHGDGLNACEGQIQGHQGVVDHPDDEGVQFVVEDPEILAEACDELGGIGMGRGVEASALRGPLETAEERFEDG